jgi:hypothetical protein
LGLDHGDILQERAAGKIIRQGGQDARKTIRELLSLPRRWTRMGSRESEASIEWPKRNRDSLTRDFSGLTLAAVTIVD